MSKPVSMEAVQAVHDEASFFKLMRDELSWPIPDDLKFDDLTYDWFLTDIGLKPQDLRGSRLVQLRPFFDNTQPWGIFFLQLASPRLYITELRNILRALSPKKRTLQDHPTWNPQNILFNLYARLEELYLCPL
ncbi:MAG: hypothetical protein ACRDGA_00025 [Bacteroidota bacterium]